MKEVNQITKNTNEQISSFNLTFLIKRDKSFFQFKWVILRDFVRPNQPHGKSFFEKKNSANYIQNLITLRFFSFVVNK